MYNPTCHITGKKDNLKMYAIRNDSGDMTGWIFVHESVEITGKSIKTSIVVTNDNEETDA